MAGVATATNSVPQHREVLIVYPTHNGPSSAVEKHFPKSPQMCVALHQTAHVLTRRVELCPAHTAASEGDRSRTGCFGAYIMARNALKPLEVCP